MAQLIFLLEWYVAEKALSLLNDLQEEVLGILIPVVLTSDVLMKLLVFFSLPIRVFDEESGNHESSP